MRRRAASLRREPPADATRTATEGAARHIRETGIAVGTAGPSALTTPETPRPGAAAERNANPA